MKTEGHPLPWEKFPYHGVYTLPPGVTEWVFPSAFRVVTGEIEILQYKDEAGKRKEQIMKATSLIKHLGLFGTSPIVRIVKRMQLVKEFETCGRDSLEEIEKFCTDSNFTVTTFTVKDNTLTINVV